MAIKRQKKKKRSTVRKGKEGGKEETRNNTGNRKQLRKTGSKPASIDIPSLLLDGIDNHGY